MKTQSKYPQTLAVICGMVAMCAATTTTVHAQSRSSSVSKGLFTHGNESFRVVNTAGFRTAADVGKPAAGTVQPINYGAACQSCGPAGVEMHDGMMMSDPMAPTMGVDLGYSQCGSCGSACGGTCGGRQSMLTCGPKNMNPCQPCSPYRYGSVEALYMAPDDDNFTLSPNFGMGDYDYEVGSRITLGTVNDCIHGFEASFTGPFDWDRSGQIASTPGGINSYLTTGAPAATLSSFTNATLQTQRLESEYYSFEASKTLVGWEMAKLLIGGRYINFDEDYAFNSTTATETGSLTSRTRNDLYGLQVGMDLLYPISRNAYSDFRARGGAYLNSSDSSVSVINNGVSLANRRDDDNSLAGMFEIGTGIRYQLGEMLSVRAGVELWYLTGIASSTEQFDRQIGPRTGTSIDTDDDLLFTGLSVGAELRY